MGPVTKPIHKFASPSDLNTIPLTESDKELINTALTPLKGELKDIIGRAMEKSIKRRKLKDELINKE